MKKEEKIKKYKELKEQLEKLTGKKIQLVKEEISKSDHKTLIKGLGELASKVSNTKKYLSQVMVNKEKIKTEFDEISKIFNELKSKVDKFKDV